MKVVYISVGEGIISFGRAETNYDKVASPKQQFTLHIICINFQVVSYADNFGECATLNAFHEQIFKLHFLLNHSRSIFSKKFVYKGRCGILFCYLVLFHAHLVRVMQQAVRHSFP